MNRACVNTVLVLIISFLIISLTLTTAMPVTANQNIPKCIKNEAGQLQVYGNLDAEYAGSDVTIAIIDKEAENISQDSFMYFGQTKVQSDGSYMHTFKIDKALSTCRIAANVGGELIDGDYVKAQARNILDIDLSVMRYEGISHAAADILDYYGLYSGTGSEYTLIIASYDENGKIVDINSQTNLTKPAERIEDNIFLNTPDSVHSVKAYVWRSFNNIIPLAEDTVTFDKIMLDASNHRESVWSPMNMVTADEKQLGLIGGEGGQRIQSIAVSSDDSLLLCGNDTGGINRSVDGGKTWEDCFRGFYPGGANAIAIDPMNKHRVLASGSPQRGDASQLSSSIKAVTGLYLSEDGGESWTQVLNQPGAVTNLDFRESLCFDLTSYDPEKGYCKVAYWSRPWRFQGSIGKMLDNDKVISYPGDMPGLWKTTDGGYTWENVNTDMSDGVVKVNAKRGYVYVANPDGVHVSYDGGYTFTTVKEGMCLGIDVINKAGYEDYVWINNGDGVFVSNDAGKTFTKKSLSSLLGGYPKDYDTTRLDADKIARNIKVSPVNPDNMVLGWYNGTNYKNKKYYSKDGGRTWSEASYIRTTDFFLANNRHPVFAWSNTNGNKLWSIGGDWIASSADAGKTYKWDYNGGGDVFVDQRTIFNVYNPDIFYYGSQDFHGALTTDGGKTWKHIWKFASEGYARVYGTYAADENTLIAIVFVDNVQKRYIFISRDGGETWNNTGNEITGRGWCKWSEICYQSPTDKNVLFAANYRSDDYGETWKVMEGVHSVNAHNPRGEKELYGTYYDTVKVSYDNGATWQNYAKVLSDYSAADTQIWDIAYDSLSDTMYFVSGGKVSGSIFGKIKNGKAENLTQNLNRHQTLGLSFQLCAVDPNVEGVVYVGGYGGGYMNPNGVQRSVDGGKTFFTLTTSGEANSIVKKGMAGGLDPYDIIVHPVTGEIWVTQGCNGWATFPAPY